MRTSSSPFGLSRAALALWAKSGDETGWLSLPQHMLDTAGVAEHLWDEWAPGSVRESIQRHTGLNVQNSRALLTWLAGVHDIGKATPTFQLQPTRRADGLIFTDALRDCGLPLRVPGLEKMQPRFPHALASGSLLRSWLRQHGVGPHIARSLADVVDSHHGIPSRRHEQRGADDVLVTYDPAWQQVHEELLGLLARRTAIHDVLPDLHEEIEGPAQTLLAGLVIMADWIASGADLFPMSSTGMACWDLDAQAARVREGVRAAELTAPWAPQRAPVPTAGDPAALIRQRFSWNSERTPRPVQAAVLSLCEHIDQPSMLIVEAPTGEGKTEAALVAAERLAHVSGAGGAVFAAPTMSTANGLFDRVSEWAARSTEVGEVSSMYLAHSKNRLNKSFERLRRFHGIGFDERSDHGDVLATAWLSGRKKGLLSNFTVATVDQVLLMALQGKHSMLRHLALAGKVVIIDEVHAYDTYMSRYLHRALRWLGHYGASVVLLSATLPRSQKEELIEAYQPLRRRRRGSPRAAGSVSIGHCAYEDRTGTAQSPHAAYPLITLVTREQVREVAVTPRADDLDATVAIIDDGVDELSDRLSGLLSDGGCALVLCNTVARAQQAFLHLDEVMPGEVELHHAAFTARDRSEKEVRLLQRLGPAARRGEGRPERLVVVATQVAEQSLDIDVDLLVTDIAPADLLVQRIGRLHRHVRPDSDRPIGLHEPRVLIRGVLATDPSPEFDSGATAIYDERLLVSTLALVLQDMVPRGFHRPSDVPHLVQTAYGEAPSIPESWSGTWEQAVLSSEAAHARARARSQTFMFPEPTTAESLQDLFRARDHDDATDQGEAAGLAQVRDSDPSVEVIPIVTDDVGYHVLPWLPGAESQLFTDTPPPGGIARVLAESTVRLPGRLTRSPRGFDDVVGHLESVVPGGWQASPLLKGQLALPLDQDLGVELGGRTLRYSPTLGLVDEGSRVSTPSYCQKQQPPNVKEP